MLRLLFWKRDFLHNMAETSVRNSRERNSCISSRFWIFYSYASIFVCKLALEPYTCCSHIIFVQYLWIAFGEIWGSINVVLRSMIPSVRSYDCEVAGLVLIWLCSHLGKLMDMWPLHKIDTCCKVLWGVSQWTLCQKSWGFSGYFCFLSKRMLVGWVG